MTVYDRVIPNESLDTLLFLTIGVLVVILFDFLMKMVRGSLTDKAGKYIDRKCLISCLSTLVEMRN